MDKSIEEVWSKGFEDEKYLIPPVIDDLYTKKSILTVDKLKSVSKKDNWSLIPISIITLIFFVIKSKLLFGLYISTLILSLFFLNRKKLKFLNTINTTQSCFQYLRKLQEMIKNNVRFTTRLLGIGLPFFGYVGICIFIFESNMENFIFDTYSSKQLLIKSIIILVSLSFIGIISLRLSNYLVYGRLIKKIDEMIDELN
ncbi:hypothetical protein N9Y83_01025 [Flavobacteriaceae bacterium]|nr:hypothetical protein [Flavobacteriaceae bacterium]MDB2674516.1 hypothetical protein [Flavobacteriaceae bacterium]